MSQAAPQAAAFYRDAVKHGNVWTLRDERGFPAPLNPEGYRAEPFWSSRSRVERVIKNVDAYKSFEPVEVPLDEFIARWLPALDRDGLRVGVNWSGPRAVGYDIEPQSVRHSLEAHRQSLNSDTDSSSAG